MENDTTSYTIKKTYIYANGQILAQHNGPVAQDNKFFYLHDRLGSVRELINASGVVVKYYTYKPFGEVFATENTENISNPFKFTGQWFDSEINEYYLRARQYDPHIGRFTTHDIVVGDFREPITLHKYLYCGNDPINRFDPGGRLYTAAALVEPVMAGYAVHYAAIGYAAYGVASGRDAFLLLGIQMEKMILPVMAITAASRGWNPVEKMIYDYERGYSLNLQGGPFFNLPGGKWVAIGTALAILTYENREEIAELFDPKTWEDLWRNINSAIRGTDDH